MIKKIKNDKKKDQESKQEINTETYLKKKKRKRENMGGIDITICLMKIKKNIKNITKISFNEKVLIYMIIYSSVINKTILNTPLPSI